MVESSFDFSAFAAVNNLWPAFVERLGVGRSQQAVRQALDLQAMHGKEGTVPVLFSLLYALAHACRVAF